MFSIVFHWILLNILVCLTNAQSSNIGDSSHLDAPSIPVHYDTSQDNHGADYDSEPMRNNGRGSHEANSQNYAAENHAVHGMPIEDFQKDMLEQHNIYRRKTCARPLKLNEDLHRQAEELAHSRANGENLPASKEYSINFYEENTGDPFNTTATNIVQSWYNYGKQYNINDPSSAAPFTQLVWKQSTEMGIGHAYNGQKLYILALYQPPGNIPNEYAANVGCPSNR